MSYVSDSVTDPYKPTIFLLLGLILDWRMNEIVVNGRNVYLIVYIVNKW